MTLVLFAVWAVAGIAAATVFVCACICGARDDRLMEAWRAERESASAALEDPESGIVLNAGGGWRHGA